MSFPPLHIAKQAQLIFFPPRCGHKVNNHVYIENTKEKAVIPEESE